jgi:hypothetical protein
MSNINLLIEKLNNFPLLKVSLVVIMVALVALIGLKIGEVAGRFIYYILH